MIPILVLILVFIKEASEAIVATFKDPKWYTLVIKFSAGLGVLYVGITQIVQDKEKEAILSKSPSIGTKVRYTDDNPPLVYFGGNLFAKDPKTKGNIQINSFDMLSVYKENNKIIFSTSIKDSKGNTLATMSSEYMKVYSELIDYNDDENGFEVVTPEHRVIFQMNLDKENLYCNGVVFYHGIYVCGDKDGMKGGEFP